MEICLTMINMQCEIDTDAVYEIEKRQIKILDLVNIPNLSSGPIPNEMSTAGYLKVH